VQTSRLEAFTDGVAAIVITIMVPELKAPESAALAALLAAYGFVLGLALWFLPDRRIERTLTEAA
jgi:uncharacterized membrane protein